MISGLETGRKFIESTEWTKLVGSGKELELHPVKRIVITGLAQVTPFGRTKETWEALLEGRSAVREFDLLNHAVSIAAPLPDDFDPDINLTKAERLDTGNSRIARASLSLAREALEMAGLRLEEGRVVGLNNDRFGPWFGSGIAESHRLINVAEGLHKNDHLYPNADTNPEQRRARDEAIRAASRRVRPGDALQIFPEEVNGRIAMGVGASGVGGNLMEACATGGSNIAALAGEMRKGTNRYGLGGGFEDALYNHPEVAAAVFAALRALSKRNNEPQKASRPFDKGRDGFIIASGGGLVFMEPLEDALARGATIYAEVLGFARSMDAHKPTELKSERVARTIAEALWDSVNQAFIKPSVTFAHATSTQVGDKGEAEALRMILGSDLRDVPVTALKSMLGHLLGGAGAVNVVNAALCLYTGMIPPTINLDDPDGEIMKKGLTVVEKKAILMHPDTALAVAYGFGGYNSALLLGRYSNSTLE